MTLTPPVEQAGPRLGFLHTSPVHVTAFDALVEEVDPSASAVSIVDEALLTRARAGHADDALLDAVRTALDRLTGAGARVVVCTCSTIGAIAERVGLDTGVPVLRVDRPMAERAVRTSGARPGAPARILVVVALGSTIDPTTALLAASAAAAGREIAVEVLRCDDAWPVFEAGRQDAFAAAVAGAVTAAVAPGSGEAGPGADVVVLAQASMAPAAVLLAGLGVPVLSSPREAVRCALDLASADRPRGLSG